ncbi:MAG: hypothetical protein H0T78_13015 [Longispora sp.]|nr:hypothetical protein [Longispora sp. (in: high G+C Gram-positive bacteria)]
MSRIRLIFSGPLDDYAELLRELHNHNVQVDIVQLDFGPSGEHPKAVLNASNHGQFVMKVVRTFVAREGVQLSAHKEGEMGGSQGEADPIAHRDVA